MTVNVTFETAQEKHFGYQWLRVRRFHRLLAGTNRMELFREAAGSHVGCVLEDVNMWLPVAWTEYYPKASEDIPPALRSEIWSVPGLR